MAKPEKLVQELSLLCPGESIRASVQGLFIIKGVEVIADGLVAATDTKLIFFEPKRKGSSLHTFLFDEVKSVIRQKKFKGHQITFPLEGGRVASIKQIQ